MEKNYNVLIIGSSVVTRLRAFIADRGWDANFMPGFRVTWFGKGGMRFDEVLPLLRERRAGSSAQPPDIIIIHAGGNSIGYPGMDRRRLLLCIKADLAEVIALFPGTTVMFSDILPRQRWRCQRGRSGYPMERTRRWLNSATTGFLTDRGMRAVSHRSIHRQLLESDGVLLSDEGHVVLYQDFHQALDKFQREPGILPPKQCTFHVTPSE